MNNTKILAKVETRQALLNFQGILRCGGGVGGGRSRKRHTLKRA